MSASPFAHVGFKEWSLVCDALGSGAQSIILRKGGIHEGRNGFWWKHDTFFLFPTHFHEQGLQFPWPGGATVQPRAADGPHTVTLFAETEFKHQITQWAEIEALRALHFWSSDAIRERFDYSENQGISMAFLRIYRLDSPWSFPDEKRFGGCRSWLDLPVPAHDPRLEPVLSDEAHASAKLSLRHALALD